MKNSYVSCSRMLRRTKTLASSRMLVVQAQTLSFVTPTSQLSESNQWSLVVLARFLSSRRSSGWQERIASGSIAKLRTYATLQLLLARGQEEGLWLSHQLFRTIPSSKASRRSGPTPHTYCCPILLPQSRIATSALTNSMSSRSSVNC